MLHDAQASMSESSTRPLTRAGNHADDSAYGGQKFDVEKTNKVTDGDIAPELQLNRKGVGKQMLHCVQTGCRG